MHAHTLLNTHFKRLQNKNHAFSLRQFAKKVGIAPSLMSQLLSGKSPLTQKTARKIAEGLCLSPDESSALLASIVDVPTETTRPIVHKNQRLLSIDEFRLIADWYHYALLSATEIEGAESSSAWLARRLGITKQQASEGIERLKRLGILKEVNGKLKQISEPLNTIRDVPSTAVRSHHFQNLQKAMQSLDVHAVESRHMASTTFAIDPKNLPKAKDAIQRFQDEMSGLLETKNKRRVYTLAVQLFPIDREI